MRAILLPPRPKRLIGEKVVARSMTSFFLSPQSSTLRSLLLHFSNALFSAALRRMNWRFQRRRLRKKYDIKRARSIFASKGERPNENNRLI